MPQALAVMVKSFGSAPVMERPEMLIVEEPLLVRVTYFCPLAALIAMEPKDTLEGDAVAAPPDEVMPVPESATVSGVVLALSVML